MDAEWKGSWLCWYFLLPFILIHFCHSGNWALWAASSGHSCPLASRWLMGEYGRIMEDVGGETLEYWPLHSAPDSPFLPCWRPYSCHILRHQLRRDASSSIGPYINAVSSSCSFRPRCVQNLAKGVARNVLNECLINGRLLFHAPH